MYQILLLTSNTLQKNALIKLLYIVDSRLEEYFNEIMDDYETLKPKIKSLLNSFNFKLAN